MVYSRLIDSVWYTFWAVSARSKEFKLPTATLKGAQIFQIYDTPSLEIKYSDIKLYGIDQILEMINVFYSKQHDRSKIEWDIESAKPFYYQRIYPAKNPTRDDIEELRKYLLMFIQEVDQQFKWNNFFKHYWIVPIKYKIKKIFSKYNGYARGK